MIKEIPVYKQGELDFACGLYCLYSIAEHFGAALPEVDAPLANLIGVKEEGLKSNGAWKTRIMPLVWGVGVEGMIKMSRELNLTCDEIVVPGDLAALKESYLSIALVLDRFDQPQGFLPSYEDSHFVIVQTVNDMLYISSSHPWKPHMYPVNDNLFMSMWMDERLDYPGWALTFPEHHSGLTVKP
jgi:hypothetical protein